ncbi:MAG: DUF1573 domain-containing protein [Verrucomicrobiaceae bacterium]|nr:DUF1573 domain-containing protein [Verrucomicrobiaceae bacterium]
MKATIVLCILASCLSATARADLVLDVKVIEVKPKPEDETASVTFTFRNNGTKAVTVTGLESACSCLSSELDRAIYEPGSTGTGKAEFKVTSFVGKHEKFVTVTTDDPAQPEWIIPFELDVPAVVDIEPKTVQWWIDEPVTSKDLVVKMLGDEPMKITKITSTREGVEFSWKEVKPGREYRITVKPKNTTDVMLGALKIETDSKIPKYARQMAFFSVYRQPASVQR